MRVYEGLFLVSNNDANKDLPGILGQIRGLIEKNGGTVHIIHKWDERKLAYEIKKLRRGTYVLCYFSAPNFALPELNREFRLSEVIVRFVITLDAEEVLPKHKVEQYPVQSRIEDVRPADDRRRAPVPAGVGEVNLDIETGV